MNGGEKARDKTENSDRIAIGYFEGSNGLNRVTEPTGRSGQLEWFVKFTWSDTVFESSGLLYHLRRITVHSTLSP